MNNESRVEKHIVKSSNQYFPILMNFCAFSKNLYNHANYIVRQEFTEKGIAVILTEESYTSGTSFIDDEEPVKTNYNKARRVHRGMFVANDNKEEQNGHQEIQKTVEILWLLICEAWQRRPRDLAEQKR